MGVGLYEVVLTSTYFSQQNINRWNYLSSGDLSGISGAFGLAYAFGAIYDEGYPTDTVLAAIAGMVSNEYRFEQLTIKNVYVPTDFFQVPFVELYQGSQSGVGMSPTAAYGFRTNLVRTDVARGTKRFSGVTENNVDAGGVIATAFEATVNLVASRMSEEIFHSEGASSNGYAPVIAGKEKYLVPASPVDDPRYAYRYYPTFEEQAEMLAEGVLWQPYETQRTQVSRQYGRGI